MDHSPRARRQPARETVPPSAPSRIRWLLAGVEDVVGRPRLRRPALQRRAGDPMDALIATLLSQNTSDVNSQRAYRNLRARFPTWDAVRTARTAAIESAIREGGLARIKAARIKRILSSIGGRYGGMTLAPLRRKSNEEVMAELTALPGVGRKTAACVLLFALGRDVFPVDTHIHRICRRTGFVGRTATADQTFDTMARLVPRGAAFRLHVAMIRFGRAVCRARDPLCWNCPLSDGCGYEGKSGRLAAAPRPRIASDRFRVTS